MDASRGQFYYFNRDMGYTTWSYDEVMNIHHDNKTKVSVTTTLSPDNDTHTCSKKIFIISLQVQDGRQLQHQMGGYISITPQHEKQPGPLLTLGHESFKF